MILLIPLALGVFGMVACLLLLIRNQLVYTHRGKVISRVGVLARLDIEAGRSDWHRWFDLLDGVSYDAMVLHFWRPLDSFYPPELRLSAQSPTTRIQPAEMCCDGDAVAIPEKRTRLP